MKQKSLLSAFLCLSLFMGLLSGCGTKATDPAAVPGEGQSAEVQNIEELSRAVQYGITTEDFLKKPDRVVTYGEFCSMLTEIVRLRDEALVSQWEALAADALKSDEPVQRDDAALSMFEAALAMGFDEKIINIMNWEDNSDAEDWWEGASWDYHLFPNWQDPYQDSDCNLFMNGVWYLECAYSGVSGKLPFEPDERMSYRFSQDVSRSEAAVALIRFAESDARILEPDPLYLSVRDAGTYDKTILTDELLSTPSDLPEVTQDQLPGEWKGTGYTTCKDGGGKYRDFQEADIAFLAQNGFNFTRLALGFSTLRFPDYPEDPYQVNENELKDLDQLLAWCVKYGVHLQIAMSRYMDAGGSDGDHREGVMPQSEDEWALTQTYWEMLARRYAGIPSRYLSFDLSNEIQPQEIDGGVRQGFAAEVAAIRAADPDRVLLHAFPGGPNMEWADYAASLGVALACHPYFPAGMCCGDYPESPFMESNLYWPRPFFNSVLISGDELTISGEGLSGVLSLYLRSCDQDTTLEFYADGTLFDSRFLPEGKQQNEYGGYDWNDEALSVDIPEGTGAISVRVSQNGLAINAAGIENQSFHTYLMCHDAYESDAFASSHLSVAADGTWSNADGRIVDAEFVYEYLIAPMERIANAHQVGLMVNEFGLFGVKVYWDIDLVTAYHQDFLEMLTRHGIGWCYCELYNGFPKHLVILYGEESQWSGATTENITVTYGDGQTAEIKVCRELLDVFRNYTQAA